MDYSGPPGEHPRFSTVGAELERLGEIAWSELQAMSRAFGERAYRLDDVVHVLHSQLPGFGLDPLMEQASIARYLTLAGFVERAGIHGLSGYQFWVRGSALPRIVEETGYGGKVSDLVVLLQIADLHAFNPSRRDV